MLHLLNIGPLSPFLRFGKLAIQSS
jgi:hypothetical protein